PARSQVAGGTPTPGRAQRRVNTARLFKHFERLLVPFGRLAKRFVSAGKIELVGRKIIRPRPPRGVELGLVDDAGAAETTSDLIGDIGLNGKELLRWLVPALGPQMGTALAIDQLRRYSDLVAFALNRAFEHVADVERPADLPQIKRLSLVDLGRTVSDDIHFAIA